MARKLTPSEERMFLEAVPLSELAFGAEECPARHIRRALDHPLFDQPAPALAPTEILFADKGVRDDLG